VRGLSEAQIGHAVSVPMVDRAAGRASRARSHSNALHAFQDHATEDVPTIKAVRRGRMRPARRHAHHAIETALVMMDVLHDR